jgi:purine catabolism regulator
LSNAGVAAIGIKTKRFLDIVPDIVKELSEEYQLPILDLAFEIVYSQTISEVLEEILNIKSSWLNDQHIKIQLLTSTLIMGENVTTFIETMAKCMEVQAAVVTSHKEMFSTYPTLSFDWPETPDLYPIHGVFQKVLNVYSTYVKDTLYFPITKDDEVIAYLICWETPMDKWPSLELLLQHALSLLTLLLTKQHSLHSFEENQKDHFLKTWVLGELTDRQTILLQAAIVGIPLKEQYRVCVTSKHAACSHSELIKLKVSFNLKGIILLSLSNEFVLLIPNDKLEDYTWLHKELKKTLRNFSLRLGFSEVKTVEHISEGYLESRKALEISHILQPGEILCHYEKLGMYPLVHFLSDQQNFKKKLFQYIKPLCEYDDKNQSKLMETLTAYLQCDGNIKESAKILYCHYNSVVYRIDKIQNLLDADLKNPEIKFQLQMALKVYELSIKNQRGTLPLQTFDYDE